MDNQDDFTHVLVVDDDHEITELLETYLTRNQFRVSTAHNGQQMMARLDKQHIDLIVLDIMMPGEDGFTLCKKVRASSSIPIIMLTAGNDETDRIIGLELGADDYMSKPFNPRELLARIKAVLRRLEDRSNREPAHHPKVRFGPWTLDTQHRQLVHERGDVFPLNGADFDLLQLFLTNPGEILSREDLFQRLKGRELSPYDRSIDVQISRLRFKLDDNGKSPQLIKTVRGQGYLLTCDVEHL
ncbi:response regulator [Salinispirillum marinum]|uniref:Response regulator n=2 Tax=Saccharospirillaceae TaxID=255527 RepID=A0ABV8BES1_9GAMM